MKTFDVPEGQFPGALNVIKPMQKHTKKGPQENIRLVFHLQVPGMTNLIPCAGRNFLLDLNPGSDLRNFLEVWLGDEFFESRSNSDFDFDALLGREGNVLLSNWQSDEYTRPHVRIDAVYPIKKGMVVKDDAEVNVKLI